MVLGNVKLNADQQNTLAEKKANAALGQVFSAGAGK